MVLLLAFFTMLIDHIWFMFFPGEDIFRIIWRISFPLFAWAIVRGYAKTSNLEKYIKRLFLLALISQIPVYFIHSGELYNVIFTLVLGLLTLVFYDIKNIPNYLKVIIIWFILWVWEYFNFEYWAYWILTILLIHIFWQQKKQIILFALLTFLFYFDKNLLQFFAILAFFVLHYTPIIKYDFKLNFYFKYLFYPVHFAILYLVFLLLN